MSQESEISSIDDEPKVDAPAPKARSPKAETVKASAGTGEVGKKLLTVTIHATDGDEGAKAVFLGVNGYGRMVPRGVPVQLPEEAVEVLRNATVTHYRPGPKGQIVEHEVPRYSFSVNG